MSVGQSNPFACGAAVPAGITDMGCAPVVMLLVKEMVALFCTFHAFGTNTATMNLELSSDAFVLMVTCNVGENVSPPFTLSGWSILSMVILQATMTNTIIEQMNTICHKLFF
jgi:hypothetical protein